MNGDIPLLPKFYGEPGSGAALAAFWMAIHWRGRDNAMELARRMSTPRARSDIVKTARERNWMMVQEMAKFRRAMAELRRQGERTA